jgi:hypothetical protein
MHSKLFRTGAVAALLLCTTGCQTVHYTTGRNAGGGRVEQNAPFFLWGLVGEKVVNMNEVCPDGGAARWKNQQTFLDGFLGTITLGIYSPRTIVIECASGTAQVPSTGSDSVTAAR